MNTAAAAPSVRVRLGAWPGDPEVVHLVLLDHHMVPDAEQIEGWTAQCRAADARAIRTGALFEASRVPFLDAGFVVIDRLTLLELDLDDSDRAGRPSSASSVRSRGEAPRLRRLRGSMLDEAAVVDASAFAPEWANDAPALTDIMTATPQHRSRCVNVDGRMVAFSISGRAGRWGYIQRLAVDPGQRRRGLGRLLVDDALRWMNRRNVSRVLVNTASDNVAALDLYRSLGFRERDDDLAILERPLHDAIRREADTP